MRPQESRHARILVIDDEDANLRALRKLLDRAGFHDIRYTPESREAAGLFREFQPDLILLDLHMPHLDGFQVMEGLNRLIPDGEYLPVLVLTGDHDQEVRQRALASGAKDFVTKPFEATEVTLRIRNLLETRFLHRQLARHNETLEQRVQERTRELADAQIEILNRLALATDYRDDVTGRHAERVGILSFLIAQTLGLHPDEATLIRRAAPLHDVGKIGIPDAILLKPGDLTPAEFEVMKSHTEVGGRILSGSGFPLLQVARDIALHHHERWDGTGYNQGIGGELIPLVGRVVAVADAFDALTHERPYKRAQSRGEALEIIRADRERHFDPRVVVAFEEVVRTGRLRELQRAEADNKVPDGAPNDVTSPRLKLG